MIQEPTKPLAASTIRSHRLWWEKFAAWCEGQELCPFPATPDTVVQYLEAHKRTVKVATLERRLIAINAKHVQAGVDAPSQQGTRVRYAMQQIRRDFGEPHRQKTALLTGDILAMVQALPDTPTGARDRLLLLLGFSMAARRSELVALNVGDIEQDRHGLLVTIRRSKTDQEGRGREIAIPFGTREPLYCPVHAFRDWLKVSGITGPTAPVFVAVRQGEKVLPGQRITGWTVARIVKRWAEAIGIDPAKVSGHSLRSGLATSAAAEGASDRTIMRTTGHKTGKQLDTYIQKGKRWRENAATVAGL